MAYVAMNILIVVATEIEISKDVLNRIKNIQNHKVDILVTGMGVPSAMYHLSKYLFSEKTKVFPLDLVVNIGIAGSFKNNLQNGEVVQVVQDTYADLGFDDKGEFKHISELTNDSLFIKNQHSFALSLKPVKGITVNTVTGNEKRRLQLMQKYHPDIETMESAAIFDVCTKEKILFIAFRAISNEVGERDKSNWNISLAVHNLWLTLFDFINSLKK